MGGAWLATHLWDHYLFTGDKNELKEMYPALKGAALFCLDWLIERDGELITSPGTSPENIYITPRLPRSDTLRRHSRPCHGAPMPRRHSRRG